MNLGIIGAGYVGLTTGICLATQDHQIIVYDVDSDKIKKINESTLPFFEKGLEEKLKLTIKNNSLKTANNLEELVKNTDGCFICVGTPTKNDIIDLSQIKESITSLANCIEKNEKNNYNIIIRSTIVPSTTKNHIVPILRNIILKNNLGLSVTPEFLREGSALSDFMNPDKIVIGSENVNDGLFVEKIFDNFKNNCEIIHTNFESAELIKYTNNAFFSMLISFSNEISNISENLSNVDPYQILQSLVSDKRITSKLNNEKIIPDLASYLVPGCGFGGSCFPKDVKAILNFANEKNISTPLLKAILEINDERPTKMISLCESILGNLDNKKISFLGLTFKPETDDLRSSPTLIAIDKLKNSKIKISIFDPIIKKNSSSLSLPENCHLSETLVDCIQDSEAILVFTKWNEFKKLDGDLLSKHMKRPLIIDGRGFLEKTKFQNCEFHKIGLVEKLD